MSIETGIGHARTRVKTVLVAFCALLALGSFGFHATRDYLNDPAAGRIGVALVLLSLAGAAALLTGLPGPPGPDGPPIARLEDLQAILGNRQANVIVAVREETSPSPEALEALLIRSGIGFTRKEVLDRVGRQAGWVFFLS